MGPPIARPWGGGGRCRSHARHQLRGCVVMPTSCSWSCAHRTSCRAPRRCCRCHGHAGGLLRRRRRRPARSPLQLRYSHAFSHPNGRCTRPTSAQRCSAFRHSRVVCPQHFFSSPQTPSGERQRTPFATAQGRPLYFFICPATPRIHTRAPTVERKEQRGDRGFG